VGGVIAPSSGTISTSGRVPCAVARGAGIEEESPTANQAMSSAAGAVAAALRGRESGRPSSFSKCNLTLSIGQRGGVLASFGRGREVVPDAGGVVDESV
jgi:hypothetical protein